MALISTDLTTWQNEISVSPAARVRIQLSFPPTYAAALPDSLKRAEVMVVALGLWLGFLIQRSIVMRSRRAAPPVEEMPEVRIREVATVGAGGG